MGLDLVLLPLGGPLDLSRTSVFCFDRLNLDRDYEIFGQLTDLSCRGQELPTIKAIPIPSQMGIESYEEGGFIRRRKDRYGKELTFLFAKQLRELEIHGDASVKNKAIKAFVDALPDDTPIVLDWR